MMFVENEQLILLQITNEKKNKVYFKFATLNDNKECKLLNGRKIQIDFVKPDGSKKINPDGLTVRKISFHVTKFPKMGSYGPEDHPYNFFYDYYISRVKTRPGIFEISKDTYWAFDEHYKYINKFLLFKIEKQIAKDYIETEHLWEGSKNHSL